MLGCVILTILPPALPVDFTGYALIYGADRSLTKMPNSIAFMIDYINNRDVVDPSQIVGLTAGRGVKSRSLQNDEGTTVNLS